jgi:5'-nucleotidase
MANRTGRAIPVTHASAFGRVITDIDMQFDPATQRISAISANNVLISQPDADLPTSPVHSYLSSTQVSAIRGLIADYATAVAPIENQVIGSISQALPSGPMASGSGEELAGDLVADSQLAATATAAKGGAVISFINGSGVRNPGFNLPNVTYPHDVTYQEAFSVRPFGDSLVSMTLTAQQLKDALEQQFAGCNGQTENNILEVSKGLHVDWSSTSAPCNRIVNVILRSSDGAAPDQIVLNHTVRHPSRRYRISVDNFLAAGKSGFSTFLKGRDQTGGPQDIDALVAFMKANYYSANKPFDPTDPSLGIPRITKVD